MAQRLELQVLLELIVGSPNVYFQPPPSVQMEYPAIVYHLDYRLIRHADNAPWQNRKRYLVTVIDRDPDSDIPDKVADLPMCSFDRFYTADDLNHYVSRLYF